MRVNTKPFRTSTFRLAALYLLFFALSTAAVLGYIYYNTVGLLERQNEETIHAEVLGLSDQYRAQGVVGVADTINRRLAQDSASIYMLHAPGGLHVAGNLRHPPSPDLPDESWIDFPVHVTTKTGSADHKARAYHVELPGDYELIVGRDVQELSQFRDLIRKAFYWAVGLSVLMGLGGGFLVSRNFLRRIDAITETSEVIMKGDLSGRMPVAGSGDELDRLSQSLNAMLAQIESLMQGMRDVSSNVAHDLKTPLTRMRARIEDALRSDENVNQHAALEQTIADCDNLLSTFNAVLSITQLDAGQQRSSLEVLDAHDILEDVADLYGPVVEDSGGAMTLDAAPGLKIRAKRELLAQAVNNLIDNALKYGETKDSGPQVTVSGARLGKDVVISVGDHGQGIPEPERERVLQRFVRLDESRSKPGNGLGLSLVASVATLLGGKLILSDNNPGLKAELHLPFAAQEA